MRGRSRSPGPNRSTLTPAPHLRPSSGQRSSSRSRAAARSPDTAADDYAQQLLPTYLRPTAASTASQANYVAPPPAYTSYDYTKRRPSGYQVPADLFSAVDEIVGSADSGRRRSAFSTSVGGGEEVQYGGSAGGVGDYRSGHSGVVNGWINDESLPARQSPYHHHQQQKQQHHHQQQAALSSRSPAPVRRSSLASNSSAASSVNRYDLNTYHVTLPPYFDFTPSYHISF